MRRTGKNGKPIYVYKMRTMHPYSEYLQGYITELFGYGEKGKVKNDFRVTAWGRFLRRLWLDEAPQLLNLLKGDLGLVGVRPLSDRFLQNYPEWLQEERKKYKPGCFPPYVAYRTQQVDQYMDSEIRYLNEKKKHPFWTDVKILFVGIFNIVTNRIRSE
jgi:lipopolysaccharide/colanic/teichoic acid biosynthesis glycosyltransferase